MLLYCIVFILSALVYLFLRRKKTHDFSNEHCLITGGSSGIGLELAIQSAKLGASVTIIARSKARLETAKEKISSVTRSSFQKVSIFSADISQKDANLKDIVEEAEKIGGPITVLINCAGTSVASRFEDTPLTDFTNMLNLNYFGSVNITQAVLPYMKKRKHGKIVFVSSLAGLIGLYGYTAYSGSKFAVLGLAEALQMEVKSYNISVTVSFPPDTDTPGYAEEIKNKPLETSKISESGGLYSAEDVAIKTLNDVMNKKFMSSVGFEGFMICTLCSGTTPVNSLFQLLIQVATMGIFRLGMYIYLLQCDHTIKKCAESEVQNVQDSVISEKDTNS